MSGTFQKLVPSWAPPWMRRDNGRVLLESFGAELDARTEQLLWARCQSNPYAGGARLADGRLIQCDSWVLPLHAEQRGIQLYATEPELSQRIRLSRWRQLHRRRGTHRGTMEHVAPYFADCPAGPTIWIVHRSGGGATVWHSLDPSGVYSVRRDLDNFDFDGAASKWSRWWAFVDLTGTGYAEPIRYDDGHRYDDGSIYGEGGARPFAAARKADLVAMFADWKSAHSQLVGVALMWSSLDPTATPTQDASGWWSLPAGHWGRTVDPVTRLGTRPPTVQWIYEYP